MEFATLSNGNKIPMLGFGVYQIPPEDTAKAVREAIEIGYRHIDTAQAYFNEEQVGEGVRESGIDRDDLFITSKVWMSNFAYEDTISSVNGSLRRLGTDHIDLMLLHQPFGDVFGAWRALEELYKDGKVRAIGVSNFSPVQVENITAFNTIAPMVNQIETNPLNQQIDVHNWLAERGIVQEAWAPFGEGRDNMFTNPVLAKIGEAHGKSVAQVILRWLIQRGIVALAKSTHKERMAQNFDIFDFTLTDDEMKTIASLDTASSLFIDHNSPDTVKMLSQFNVPRD